MAALQRPVSFSAALTMILLCALVWLALGVIIAADAHPGLPDLPFLKLAMAVLSLAAAAVLAGLFFLLARRRRAAYFLALGCLAVASLLTVFDDFGLADLAVLMLHLIPLALLVKNKAWYLHPGP